jgi:hypothetical protein
MELNMHGAADAATPSDAVGAGDPCDADEQPADSPNASAPNARRTTRVPYGLILSVSSIAVKNVEV